jgi:hypothetical protein
MSISPITRGFIAGVLLASLTGCGYLFGDQGVFRDNSQDYKKASEMAVISVPEGKETDTLQEIYPVPPTSSTVVQAGAFEVPRPAPVVKTKPFAFKNWVTTHGRWSPKRRDRCGRRFAAFSPALASR